MRHAWIILAFFSVGTLSTAEEATRVLFLSKSSTFIHSTIQRVDGQPSHLDALFERLAVEHGFEIESTKDAGRVNAQTLKDFDIVFFYTTGDLTKSGTGDGGIFSGDAEPAMGEAGLKDLLTWIEGGGGFMGYHCASDTFHGPRDGPVSAYIDMLGGEFLTHGPKHFFGTVNVVDPTHPTMRSLPKAWNIRDEWYVHKNYNRDAIHVLALFDPGAEGAAYRVYRREPYPIVWCRTYGEGRVFYNAMGHREDVWGNPVFQQGFIDALNWLVDDLPAQADANFNGDASAPNK